MEERLARHPRGLVDRELRLLRALLRRGGNHARRVRAAVGGGPRDADITAKLNNGLTAHVDVEAVHKPEFGAKTEAEIRALLEARAQAKAASKFGHLPSGEAGIVAEVAVVSINDVDRRFERTPPGAPRPLPGTVNQFWMPLRLVGVRDPELQFMLDEL